MSKFNDLVLYVNVDGKITNVNPNSISAVFTAVHIIVFVFY